MKQTRFPLRQLQPQRLNMWITLTGVLLMILALGLFACSSTRPTVVMDADAMNDTGGQAEIVVATEEFGGEIEVLQTLRANPEGIKFETISIEDGLSQSSINTIYQDSAGFLWFGTLDGLN